MHKKLLLSFSLLAFLQLIMPYHTIHCHAQPATDILQRIIKLDVTTTVLYVAAHPDDENTRLITWLSKEKLFRTAYLSLTRGDGGQNLIGAELGVELGLIRSRELLAARAIDGGEQYFTRAFDFGFSKSPEETIGIWNRDKILEDFVYIIRSLKPDVIICRFPPDSRAGHGHHSSSAILAKEAFDIAQDPAKFPEQVGKWGIWKVKRMYWNTFRFGSNNTTSEQQIKTDVGGYNPLLGKSYGELAAESRSQHKSQGFGVPSQRGTQIEYFSPVAGDTAVNDIFKNEKYWYGLKGGKEISETIQRIASKYNFSNPSASVPDLITLRKQISSLPPDHINTQKLKELDQVITDCIGLWKAAYAYSTNYAINDTMHVSLQLIVRNFDSVMVTMKSDNISGEPETIPLSRQTFFSKNIIVNGAGAFSQPYWLRMTAEKGAFQIPDKSLTGKAWNDYPLVLKANLRIEDVNIPLEIPITFKETDPVKGESVKPLIISPLITGSLSEDMSVFCALQKRKYKLKLLYSGSSPGNFHIKARLTGDERWNISFKDTILHFMNKGEEKEITYYLNPTMLPLPNAVVSFSYTLENGKEVSMYGFREIQYNHIPPVTWFPELKTEIKFVELKQQASRILYIKGAGDEVAAMIRQTGIQADEVHAEDIFDLPLDNYDAVVCGIRAYNTDEKLPLLFDNLMEYVKNGGTFIVQYNTNSNLHPASYMSPYPYSISRNRVTEEDASVTFTSDNEPLLNFPNKITSTDFEGWVQERGLYFATKADSAFRNVLLMNDKGENPQEGSLIAANYGKGTYIYTGLSFFRQLPAGVPGAFRLFANLIGQKQVKRDMK